MKVAELIEWLRAQPQDAEVMIHDADTDCFLPLKTGVKEFSTPDEAPAGAICVHCDYYDYKQA